VDFVLAVFHVSTVVTYENIRAVDKIFGLGVLILLPNAALLGVQCST